MFMMVTLGIDIILFAIGIKFIEVDQLGIMTWPTLILFALFFNYYSLKILYPLSYINE